MAGDFKLDPILTSPGGKPLKLFVEFDWSGPDAALLLSAVRRMQDYGPLLRTIGRLVVGSSKRSFFEQHSPEGQVWPPLKKPRGKGRNPSSRALFDTGKLYESITYELEGEDAVVIGFGEEAFYGRFHQGGTRHIPARPFIGIGPDDLPSMSQMLRGHVEESISEAA